MRLIIISGRSGSGKTIALHVLEDLGFYCIDNLPIDLLPELHKHVGGSHAQIAVSIDARNIPQDLTHFKIIIQQFTAQPNHSCEIIYLDANDSTLLKRFSETRRKHPLSSKKTTLREAIQQEHQLLTPIASLADLTIDTTPLTHTELHHLIRDRVAHHDGSTLQLLLQSFGFKFGLPPDSDFVFDVRCLPNPYWEPILRPLTGIQAPVIEFLESQPHVQKMRQDIITFLTAWIPRFAADNRSYITIAIGCTGGQHRSVYMVDSIAKEIRKSQKKVNIQVRHREIR